MLLLPMLLDTVGLVFIIDSLKLGILTLGIIIEADDPEVEHEDDANLKEVVDEDIIPESVITCWDSLTEILVVVGVAMILIMLAYLLTIGSDIVSIGVSYSQAD